MATKDPGADRLVRVVLNTVATGVGALTGPFGAVAASLFSSALGEVAGLAVEVPDPLQPLRDAFQDLPEEEREALLEQLIRLPRLPDRLDDPTAATETLLDQIAATGEVIDDQLRSTVETLFLALDQQRVTLLTHQDHLRAQLHRRFDDLDHRLARLAAPYALLHLPARPLPDAAAAPSYLLRADHEVVPYERRPRVEADLAQWREEGAPFRIRLYTAPGGAGKSRLFLQQCRDLGPEWERGFLDAEKCRGLPPERWERLVEGTAPLFLVIDYADGRRDEVTALLRAIDARARHRKIRLVLLAREAGEWWENLALESPGGRELINLHGEHRPLPPLGDAPTDRPQLFRAAFDAFARYHCRFGLSRPPPLPEPDFSGDTFDTALMIHTLAYLAAAGDGAATADHKALFGAVMDHERRHWKRIIPDADGTAGRAQLDALRELVALATLTGGLPRGEARDWIDRTPIASRLDFANRHTLATDWPRLYPGPERIEPLRPDRLGEWLVADVLAKEADGLLPLAFHQELPDEALENGLTVLARIAKWNREDGEQWLTSALAHDYPRLAPLALEIATTEWEGLGRLLHRHLHEHPAPATAERLGDILDDRYQQTLALRELAEEATRQRLGAIGGENETALAEKAGHLNNVALRLSDLGRREESLDAAREAADLYRQLAEARPDAFRPNLAMSLNNLANSLSNLGRREEALDAAREAADLYRQLAEARPDAFRPNLAMSLNNLANRLSELGRREETLDTAREAVEIGRQLTEARPDAFRPNLAASLNNLATFLRDLGQREEALDATREAVEIRRQLTEARPDAFRPDLAMSLNNLATSLSELGRREEALDAAREAVDLYRQLAEARPHAFRPDLAMSLNNLGVLLGDLGRREEALDAAREAVDLYRQLAKARPDAFTENLCQSLWTLASTIDADGGGHEEALTAFAEGIERLTPYLQRLPAAFAPLMQGLVSDYLNQCKRLEREPDAELLGPVDEVFQRFTEGPEEEG